MRGRLWVLALTLLPPALLAERYAGTETAWHYTLNQPRHQQQANFCRSEQDVIEIAGIFHRLGPKTGYSALAQSPHCSTSVQTFTPRKRVTHVVISEGKPGEYTMHFVEVENRQGEILYLVTTRDVKPD